MFPFTAKSQISELCPANLKIGMPIDKAKKAVKDAGFFVISYNHYENRYGEDIKHGAELTADDGKLASVRWYYSQKTHGQNYKDYSYYLKDIKNGIKAELEDVRETKLAYEEMDLSDEVYYYTNYKGMGAKLMMHDYIGMGTQYHTIALTFMSNEAVENIVKEKIEESKRLEEEREKEAIRRTFQNMISEAKSNYEKGYYETALKGYESAFNYSPNDSSLYSNQAKLCRINILLKKCDEYIRNKKYVDAKQCCSKALKYDPNYNNTLEKLNQIKEIENFLSSRETYVYQYEDVDGSYNLRIRNDIYASILKYATSHVVHATTISLEYKINLDNSRTKSWTLSHPDTMLYSHLQNISFYHPQPTKYDYPVNAVANYSFNVVSNCTNKTRKDEHGKEYYKVHSGHVNGVPFEEESFVKYYDKGGADNVFLSLIFPAIARHRVEYWGDAGDWARTNLIFGVYGSMLLIPIGNFMKKEGETRDERRTGENTAMWGYGITITSRLINTIVIAAKASKNIKASKKNQLSFVPIQTMDNKYALGTSYSIDF